MENLLIKAEESLLKHEFENGLTSYTQSNCRVTLTNNGYRIYRPPNLTRADDGDTMWGGFVLRNAVELIKNHTYVLYFDIRGKSSNAAEYYWNNNCGWGGGGGLTTNPTNVSVSTFSANFEGFHQFKYKWTVSDDVYKTCTSSYSSFVEGNSYNTYRDFKFGFNYTNTGDLGTDIYITNLRMYDITNEDESKINISKNGILTSNNYIEGYDKTSFLNYSSDVLTNKLYEY